MHATAEALEVAEDVLHNSADTMPNPETAARLHAVGDNVTAEAHHIEHRADKLRSDRPGGSAS